MILVCLENVNKWVLFFLLFICAVGFLCFVFLPKSVAGEAIVLARLKYIICLRNQFLHPNTFPHRTNKGSYLGLFSGTGALSQGTELPGVGGHTTAPHVSPGRGGCGHDVPAVPRQSRAARGGSGKSAWVFSERGATKTSGSL